jgi:hypothetical protein
MTGEPRNLLDQAGLAIQVVDFCHCQSPFVPRDTSCDGTTHGNAQLRISSSARPWRRRIVTRIVNSVNLRHSPPIIYQ